VTFQFDSHMSLLLQDEVEGPAPPDVGAGGAEVLEQLVVAVPGLFQGVGKDAQSRPAYVPVGGVSRVVRRLGQADDGPVVAAAEEGGLLAALGWWFINR
jgi:hypothetical protein